MFNNNLRAVLPNSFWKSSLLISVDIDKSRGSAFVYSRNSKVFIVTAKHVLFNDDNIYGEILMVSCPQLGSDPYYEMAPIYTFSLDMKILTSTKARSLDLAVIYIGDTVESSNGIQTTYFLNSVDV